MRQEIIARGKIETETRLKVGTKSNSKEKKKCELRQTRQNEDKEDSDRLKSLIMKEKIKQ